MAFAETGRAVPGSTIHRRVGLTGTDLVKAITSERGDRLSPDEIHKLDHRHSELYHQFLPHPEPLPGAVELLDHLRRRNIPHAIATSSGEQDAATALAVLRVPDQTVVIKRGDVDETKPEPDPFLACCERLALPARDCWVIGDAVWDILAAKKAGMHSVALLCGGYGRDELTGAGADLLFRDPQELLDRFSDLELKP